MILVIIDAVCSIDTLLKLQTHSENNGSFSGIYERETVN